MRALILERLGDPRRDPGILSLRDVAEPRAAEGQAVVRVALTAINPSDFLFTAGEFPGPVRPVPGQVAGLGGAGHVEASAEGGPPAGALVSFHAFGCWAERVAVPAESLIPLPPDMPLELAAQFPNVITAWDLVDRSGVQPGGWLALTAGYSTVATLALQFAARRGVQVLSIVRRRRGDRDLAALGAKAVIAADDGDLGQAVLEATRGAGLDGVIDCVAGPAVGDLIRVCSPFSKLQLYGSLDPNPIKITGPDILYRGLQIAAYSYPFSFRHPTEAGDFDLIGRVSEEAANGRLHLPIGGVHPMADYADAIAAMATGFDAGKRFLRMAD